MSTVVIITVCLLTLASCLVIFSINLWLLIQIFIKEKIKRNRHLILFFYRFALDLFCGFCLTLYILYILLLHLFPENLEFMKDFIFYSALPALNLGETRAILALSISIDRITAAYFPLFYLKHRQRLNSDLIFTIAMLYGVSGDLVLYGFCEFQLKIEKSCMAFGCTVNKCFIRFWIFSEMSVFLIISALSIILCVKLYYLNNFGKAAQRNSEISKANRLALVDIMIIAIFDILPEILVAKLPETLNFKNVGPFNAFFKSTGYAIESVLVVKTLIKRYDVAPNNSKNSKLSKSISSS